MTRATAIVPPTLPIYYRGDNTVAQENSEDAIRAAISRATTSNLIVEISLMVLADAQIVLHHPDMTPFIRPQTVEIASLTRPRAARLTISQYAERHDYGHDRPLLFLDEALEKFGGHEHVWLWASLKSHLPAGETSRAIMNTLRSCRGSYAPSRFLISATDPRVSLRLIRDIGDLGRAFFDYVPQGGAFFRWMLGSLWIERRLGLEYAALDASLVSQPLIDRMQRAMPGIRALAYGPLEQPILGLFGAGPALEHRSKA